MAENPFKNKLLNTAHTSMHFYTHGKKIKEVFEMLGFTGDDTFEVLLPQLEMIMEQLNLDPDGKAKTVLFGGLAQLFLLGYFTGKAVRGGAN